MLHCAFTSLCSPGLPGSRESLHFAIVAMNRSHQKLNSASDPMYILTGRVASSAEPEKSWHWGPIPLPGNQTGHIGHNDQLFILERTGWKVSSRYRKHWGSKMLAGSCQDEDSLDDMNESIELAREIILAQQRTWNDPVQGATHVATPVTASASSDWYASDKW